MASREGGGPVADAHAAGPLILGFEEWVALPELGLPAIRAKIDTGAKTSALHADAIELSGPAAAPMVRFVVHPVPRRARIEIVCTAPLIDRREVTSSNGDRELRYVIASTITVGPASWPIEITLTNRAAMSYRMLLGRQALRAGVLIDPGHSFRQPRLGYRIYGTGAARAAPVAAASGGVPAMSIALVGRRLDGPTAKVLHQAIEHAGHRVVPIDPARARLELGAEGLVLTADGRALAMPDAALTSARAMTRAFDVALWRHLEAAGVATLVGADALALAADRIALAQRLAAEGFVVARDLLRDDRTGRARVPRPPAACSVLVLEGRAAIACPAAAHGATDAAKQLAHRIAEALGVAVLQVDFAHGTAGLEIAALSLCPALAAFGGRGKAEAATLVRRLEQRVAEPARRLSGGLL